MHSYNQSSRGIRSIIIHMPVPYSYIAGKMIKRVAKLRGGGSALPGLFVERIDPEFMKRTLSQCEQGVVLISGTNGKTTTTKMVVELLEGQGLKVFTNRTGSNFTRGVTAALVGAVDKKGILDADIAVLELDEAHAVHFARSVAPTYSLFLNVMRDQLDRFGEIDTTAHLLRKIAELTTKGLVINRDDPRLSSQKFLSDLKVKDIRTYGVSDDLRKLFPSDDAMRDDTKLEAPSTFKNDDTALVSITESKADIQFAGKNYSVNLKLKGIYNIQNAVGAIALVRQIMQDKLDEKTLLESLSQVQPAFGRGETILVNGQPTELVLVKNPSGFRLSLASFDPKNVACMIAINDKYADGRDMSWLWDVDFHSLQAEGVTMVSGVRAYDMALRLQYDDVEVTTVSTDLGEALNKFIEQTPDMPRRIFCTYTAMLALRRQLAKTSTVEEV